MLVESHSQDAAVNAGLLSVYLTTDRQLFFDIERENIRYLSTWISDVTKLSESILQKYMLPYVVQMIRLYH